MAGSGGAFAKMQKSAWLACLAGVAFLVVSVEGGVLSIASEALQGRTISPSATVTRTQGSHSLQKDWPNNLPSLASSSEFHAGVYKMSTQYSDTSGENSRTNYHCTEEGFFPKSGSCTEFIHCERLPETELFHVYILSCPLGTVFDSTLKICNTPLDVILRPECLDRDFDIHADSDMTNIESETERTATNLPGYFKAKNLPILKRRKRLAAATVFAGLSALGGILSGTGVLSNTILTHTKGGGPGLQSIENKLTGVEGKLRNVEIAVLESQTEHKIRSQIIQSLIEKGTENIQNNFEVTQNLISKGILENRYNTAVTQGLIAKGNAENAMNFGKVQVSIGQLKEFVNQEINSAKAEIREGFQSLSNLIEQTQIAPLVTKILTKITDFHQKLNHVKNLPETNKRDEIERSGGYINYLESSTLQADLYEIIHQQAAIPKDASDLQAIFILDLLVHGLQVHTSMLSSTVLSNVYLAGKTLHERNLEDFNSYMLRVSSSIEKMKVALGYAGNHGLLQEIKTVIDNVHNLSYASSIRGVNELLPEKRAALEQIESDIASLISDNTELSDPGEIKGKISFAKSSVPVPIGPWQAGKKVTYAIQLVSENGLSKVGRWSAPYTVENRACPTVFLPTVAHDIVRLIYRRFNEEKPELVAIVTDHTQSSFRDIGRDILNAAGTPNEDIAVKDTTVLLDNSADINVWIESKMTPLHYAAKCGNVQVMKLLLGREADIHAKSSDNEEALHFAALFGTDEGVEYLISKGANINAQTKLLGLSALHIAVANDHVDTTKALLRKGAFVNIKDNFGLTPLHMSLAGNGDTIDVLLEQTTIDINIAAEDGLTPLHYAARSTNEVFVRKLFHHKDTNANILTESKVTPLHFAAMSADVPVIADLIQQGADISAADADGSTPLHYAAFYGNKRAALALMQIDNSLANIKNNEHKTPLDFAVENNWESVIEVLQNDSEKLVEIIRAEFFEQTDRQRKNDDSDQNNSQVNSETSDENETSSCSKNIANKMANGTEGTCAQIGHVEGYVNLVMAMIPLKIYYENHDEFSTIFGNYDHDLEVAQRHAKIWRNGDSIIMGIRNTFELAREFEPEFTRKYKINQNRVQIIRDNVDQAELINQTKADILRLEEELANATKAMNQVQVQAVMQYFRDITNNIQSQIDEKRRMLNEDFTLIPELKELISFLEFVRHDSSKISEVAVKTKEKIELFRDHLVQDQTAFTRHSQVASDTFEKLQKDTIAKNQELQKLKTQQEKLEKDIETQRNQTKTLYANIQESQKQMQEMRRKIMDEMDSKKGMKIAGIVLSIFIPPLGIGLLAAASEQEKALLLSLQENMESFRQEIDLLNAQVGKTYNAIDLNRQIIANSSGNSDKVRREMNVFIAVNRDLKTLQSDLATLLEAIGKAITGVQVMKNIFDDVTNKLTEMIDLATTAKTQAERVNAKYFIYNELSLLQCNWRDIYWKVTTLDICTRNFQIMY